MGNSESRAVLSDYLDELGQCDLAVDTEAAPLKEEFWNTIFDTPLSVEEVFEIITPEWVRNLRDERPYNMQFLLRKIVGKIEEVCSTGLTDHQQDEGGGSRELTLGQRTEALQCVRLLTRIAPFLLEDVEAEGTLTLLWHAGGLVVRDCGDSVVVEPAPPPTERSTNGKDE
ncbi:cell wall bioproteinsis protein, partial [Perkinsus olseni]